MGNEWVWVAVVALVIFGSAKLPQMARSLGQAQGEFKKGLKDGQVESENSTDES